MSNRTSQGTDTASSVDGELLDVDGAPQVRFVRTLAHPPEKVWRALTEDAHLTRWFPTEIVGDRVVGASLRFEFREGEGPAFDGTMLTFDPPSVLAFMWGDELLRFELTPDEAGTILTLTDTLPEIGIAARQSAGWHVCLDSLALELAGAADPHGAKQHWREVNASYVEAFGPEASTVGPPMDH